MLTQSFLFARVVLNKDRKLQACLCIDLDENMSKHYHLESILVYI